MKERVSGAVRLAAAAICSGCLWATGLSAQTVVQFAPQWGPTPSVLGDVQHCCYDSTRGEVVMVGVANGSTLPTHTWDGATLQAGAALPFATGVHGLVDDPARQRVVLVATDGATYEWDGAVWSLAVPAGAGPDVYEASLGYDGQDVLLYGWYFGPAGWTADTFRYDGVGWSTVTPTTAPVVRFDAQLAYDPRRDVCMMVDAAGPELFEWNGSDWGLQAMPPWSSGREHVAMGFHAARGELWFAGGRDDVTPPFSPPNTFVYDSVLETWAWDGQSFQPRAPLAGPVWFGKAVTTPTADVALLGGIVPVGNPQNPNYMANLDVQELRSVQPAALSELGPGCAGTAGVPQIGASPWNWPWTGDDLRLDASAIPLSATGVIWALGLSSTADAFGPLPRELSALGAPGCWQRVSLELLSLEPAAAGASHWTFPIPAVPQLAGFALHAQLLVPDANANAFGFVVSNAVELVVGVR